MNLLLFGAFAISSAVTQPLAHAEDKLDFFEHNMASTVFGDDVKMLLPRFEDKEGNIEANKTLDIVDENGTPQKSLAEGTEKVPLRDQLAKKYGDPKAEPQIRVQDNAPPAFKAMMEALDAGDDDLAFDYAQQHIRSLQKYQKFFGRVVSMTGEVMKSDGQAEGSAWDKVPTLYEDQQITAKRQDAKIQEILKRAAEVVPTASPDQKDLTVNRITYSRKRADIRAALSKEEMPSAEKNGAVDIFYFLDPASPSSHTIAAEVEHLKKFRQGDKRVTIVGLTLSTPQPGALDSFKAATKSSFSIKDGSVLAEKFGIKKSPAFAVVMPTEKRVIIEDGPATFEYLDELISRIQGVIKS